MKLLPGFDYTFCNLKKCTNHKTCVRYLGHYTVPEGMRICVFVWDENSQRDIIQTGKCEHYYSLED